MKNAITLIAVAGIASTASANLAITELFTGLSGEDGTSDWIEITNTGTTTIDTGNFFYDDSGPNLGDAGQLDSIILAAGHSAIFLEDADAADDTTYANSIVEFQSIWDYTGPIGLTNGGGGLSNDSADSANLLDAGGAVISTAAYAAGQAGGLATIDFTSGSAVLSSLGVNGAYESNSFFNDNLGLPGDTASIIGSPVPAPGALALVAIGGLAGARRRR